MGEEWADSVRWQAGASQGVWFAWDTQCDIHLMELHVFLSSRREQRILALIGGFIREDGLWGESFHAPPNPGSRPRAAPQTEPEVFKVLALNWTKFEPLSTLRTSLPLERRENTYIEWLVIEAFVLVLAFARLIISCLWYLFYRENHQSVRP